MANFSTEATMPSGFFFFFSIFLISKRVFLPDSHGQSQDSLQGVTVNVKSTSTATVTNTSGTFSIKAKERDVLVLGSVSFATKEITVSSASVYNLVKSNLRVPLLPSKPKTYAAF